MLKDILPEQQKAGYSSETPEKPQGPVANDFLRSDIPKYLTLSMNNRPLPPIKYALFGLLILKRCRPFEGQDFFKATSANIVSTL